MKILKTYINENVELVKILAVILQALTAVLLLFITTWLMCVSNRIADNANKISELSSRRTNEVIIEQRKKQVRPILRVGAKRIIYNIGTYSIDVIVIKLKNIGTGSAQNVGVVIRQDTADYAPYVFNMFYPIGTFPKKEPQYLISNPVYNGPIDVKDITPVDYILPNQEVEFQYGIAMANHRPDILVLTLFLSYYDIDNQEFLTSTLVMPGAVGVTHILGEKASLFDSLNKLSNNLKPYQYKTLKYDYWRKSDEPFPMYNDSVDADE